MIVSSSTLILESLSIYSLSVVTVNCHNSVSWWQFLAIVSYLAVLLEHQNRHVQALLCFSVAKEVKDDIT